MNLVDANLLLYAVMSGYEQHPRARAWLEDQLNGPVRVGLPWVSLMAFLRIGTNHRVFARPMPPELAWGHVESWLALPAVWVPGPTDRHGQVLGAVIRQARPKAGLLTDAHLAAIAIEHGLTICSTDSDFARFDGLRWVNPLA